MRCPKCGSKANEYREYTLSPARPSLIGHLFGLLGVFLYEYSKSHTFECKNCQDTFNAYYRFSGIARVLCYIIWVFFLIGLVAIVVEAFRGGLGGT